MPREVRPTGAILGKVTDKSYPVIATSPRRLRW